jgi:hypothetical protein
MPQIINFIPSNTPAVDKGEMAEIVGLDRWKLETFVEECGFKDVEFVEFEIPEGEAPWDGNSIFIEMHYPGEDKEEFMLTKKYRYYLTLDYNGDIRSYSDVMVFRDGYNMDHTRSMIVDKHRMGLGLEPGDKAAYVTEWRIEEEE